VDVIDESRAAGLDALLRDAAGRAQRYLRGLAGRPVAPAAEAVRAGGVADAIVRGECLTVPAAAAFGTMLVFEA